MGEVSKYSILRFLVQVLLGEEEGDGGEKGEGEGRGGRMGEGGGERGEDGRRGR